jgi:ATP/maltotriose-dependent transcriptional regulator MalT
VHRVRGELAAAEQAYRSASEYGAEPQPGLALLCASQGRVDAAASAIEVTLRSTTERMKRARLLPAAVEIALQAGKVDEARRDCVELERIAMDLQSDELDAIAAYARASLDLADGDPQSAVVSARRAVQVWQRNEAPYMIARARVLAGLAYRALDDQEDARLELDAARIGFERLGAATDLARLDAIDTAVARPHRLTARELQVLRVVASGKTNKAIAAELSLSEKTIDRHVSNIFVKLEVTSRAAATARAYEYRLIRAG